MTTVLRYFDDDAARGLLGRIVAVMPADGRLVLSEMPIPDGRAVSPSAMKSLTEWVLTGGRDRTVGQFRELFSLAGLELLDAREYQDPYWLVVAGPA
jgi:cyclopropane fatty-acyl-phospholipid synthase-like methyltransferase